MQSLLLCFGKLRAQIRNYHVPACQHAPLGPHFRQLLATRIENLDFLSSRGHSDIACANHRAVQAKSQWSIFSVQAAVVDLCGDNIFRRVRYVNKLTLQIEELSIDLSMVDRELSTKIIGDSLDQLGRLLTSGDVSVEKAWDTLRSATNDLENLIDDLRNQLGRE